MNRHLWPAIGPILLSSALIFSTASIALVAGTMSVEAKILGGTHCYFGICHRVKTLAETEKLIGVKATVKASFYDDCKRDRFNPCGLTASGEVLPTTNHCCGASTKTTGVRFWCRPNVIYAWQPPSSALRWTALSTWWQ